MDKLCAGLKPFVRLKLTNDSSTIINEASDITLGDNIFMFAKGRFHRCGAGITYEGLQYIAIQNVDLDFTIVASIT